MECSIIDCAAPSRSRGFCTKHYARWLRHGDPLQLGKRPNGTGSLRKDGYWEFTIGGQHWLEHRYVWSQAHGSIPDGALVHHVNGDRGDNRLENLELVASVSDHLHLKHGKGSGRGSGVPKSQEHRAKISAALRGKAKSEEHRRKLSESAKRRHVRSDPAPRIGRDSSPRTKALQENRAETVPCPQPKARAPA